MKVYLLVFLTIPFFSTVSAQLIDFEFIDTIQYSDANFRSTETVFNDIADDGRIVGYYKNENDLYSGLVVLADGSFASYDFVGYNNTILTGINDVGLVVGKAYNSLSNAIVFQASIVNGIVDQAVEIDWNDPNGMSKDVGKLNDLDVAVGTARIASQNWLHYESVRTPFTVNQSRRYSTSPPYTTYVTYGLGLNNLEKYTGWYLDGVDRTPYIFDGISDSFFPQAHFPGGSGIPRTYLNDINNNNYVALSYRLPSGNMAGSVGLYNGASMTYDNNFQILSFDNFELFGINDNEDVVGYYENANAEKFGLVLLTEGPSIDNFLFADDALLFDNDSATFEYPLGTFDYYTQDEYLGIADSFYTNYIADINFAINAEQQLSLNNGLRNISWPGFVRARPEERSYITQNNGTKIPREEAIIKWLEKSTDDFTGYCFGMSVFALQNLSNPSLLLNRFPSAYTPENNAVDYFANTLPFKEMMGTLHLQQLASKFDSTFIYQGAMNSALGDQNFTALEQLMRPFVHDVVEGIKTGDPDSCYVLEFKTTFPSNFFHAVTPFKVTRAIDLTFSKDTFHCIDPNYPGNVLKIAVDYTANESRGYIGNQLVYGIGFLYHSSYLRDIMPEEALDFREVTNGQASPKSNPDKSLVHVGELCNYTVSNVSNPSEEISLSGGVFNSSWNDLGTFANMDDDGEIDFLIGQGTLNIESTLSGCADRNKISYTYPNGTFLYQRGNVLASETDIVRNNGNEQVVVNQDNVVKELNLLVISSEEDETESTVAIKGYELPQNQMVSLEMLDAHHFLLTNDENNDKTYDLVVNYVDADFLIHTTLSNISISLETSHTIVVQPEVEGEEVVILVDEGIDGSVEDTLFGSVPPPPTPIQDLYNTKGFNVFPNPSSGIVQIEIKTKAEELLHLELTNTHGQKVWAQQFETKSVQNLRLDFSTIPKGIYLLKAGKSEGELVLVEKLVLE